MRYWLHLSFPMWYFNILWRFVWQLSFLRWMNGLWFVRFLTLHSGSHSPPFCCFPYGHFFFLVHRRRVVDSVLSSPHVRRWYCHSRLEGVQQVCVAVTCLCCVEPRRSDRVRERLVTYSVYYSEEAKETNKHTKLRLTNHHEEKMDMSCI